MKRLSREGRVLVNPCWNSSFKVRMNQDGKVYHLLARLVDSFLVGVPLERRVALTDSCYDAIAADQLEHNRVSFEHISDVIYSRCR